MKPSTWIVFCGAVMVTVLLSQPVAAQVPPGVLPPPFPTEPPHFPEEIPPAPPPSPILPPAPQPPPTAKPLPLSVFVREIRIVGSTVFTPAELATITAPYTNRKVNAEDLEALRMALTKFYIDHGYVTSGAILPDQDVREGVVTYQIIEGRLSRIDIEGNHWFLPGYFQDRIELGAGPPVNVNTLQEKLQLLQETPGITRLNAELKPGIQRGESVMNVRVLEEKAPDDPFPFKAWVEFNNYLSPSVGAEEGLVTLAHQSLTGHGDIASVQYGRSLGVDPLLTARYIVPVTARNTTVAVEYRKNDFRVTEAPFKDQFGIQSKSEILGLTVRHPVLKTLNQELGLALTGEYLTNKLTSTLTEDPAFVQALVPGSHDGVSRVSALRFSQDWTRRDPSQVIAAFSRLSFGLDVLGATGKDPTIADSADSKFIAWLFQTQWARRFEPLKMQLVARLTVQLANAHLFPLEQIAVGGRYSVRGYRENTLVRDNAEMGSLEARIPLLRSYWGEDRVFVAPFFDVGRGTNTNAATPSPDTLVSAGLGFIWNIRQGSRFEIYWGQQLHHFSTPGVPTPGGNLQDHGLHLQLVVEAL